MAGPVFDSVIIGGRQRLTATEFLALPLHLRIAHVLARDLRFFAGTTEVDRVVALKSLRIPGTAG